MKNLGRPRHMSNPRLQSTTGLVQPVSRMPAPVGGRVPHSPPPRRGGLALRISSCARVPAPDKWLTTAAPTDPVASVAQLALKTRLSAVARYLHEATRGDDPVEGVHQLRIWARRSAAALRLFGAFVPRRGRRWLRRTLRKLRRTAGGVRDADVQLAALSAEGRSPPRGLRKRIRRRRRAARRRLAQLARRLGRRARLERRIQRLVDRVALAGDGGRPGPTFGPWARAALRREAAEFFALMASDAPGDEALHALRIAAKRLRYVLELAVAALPRAAARALYGELTELQDRLGVVCDHRAMLERLYDWGRPARGGLGQRKLRRLLEQEIEQLIAARAAFRSWWSPSRRTRFQRQWNAALAGRGRRK